MTQNPMYNEPGLGSGASYGSGYPTAVSGSESAETMQPTAMLAPALMQVLVQGVCRDDFQKASERIC